jgi:hypothetical protein
VHRIREQIVTGKRRRRDCSQSPSAPHRGTSQGWPRDASAPARRVGAPSDETGLSAESIEQMKRSGQGLGDNRIDPIGQH